MCVCVYLCVCSCVHMCECVHMHVHVYAVQMTSSVLLLRSIFARHGLLLAWNSSSKRGWPVSPRIYLSLPPTQCTSPHWLLWHGFWGWNSGSQTCKASALPTEPPPRPLTLHCNTPPMPCKWDLSRIRCHYKLTSLLSLPGSGTVSINMSLSFILVTFSRTQPSPLTLQLEYSSFWICLMSHRLQLPEYYRSDVLRIPHPEVHLDRPSLNGNVHGDGQSWCCPGSSLLGYT